MTFLSTLKSKLLPFLVFLVIATSQFFFVVQQGEKAVLLRFGKTIPQQSSNILEPGLHFKLPIIDSVYTMSSKVQINDIESDKIQNKEQVYLVIDFYVKWQIDDFEKFFKVNASGGRRPWVEARSRAESLLVQKAKNALLDEIGQRTLARLVQEDRHEVVRVFSDKMEENLKNLGISLVDIRIKRIDLPDDVSERVYNRMKTDRETVAAMHRAQGKEISEKIRASTDAQKVVCFAQAELDAQSIRAQTDEEVAQIFDLAYKKNPEFFQYYRTLEAYKNALNNKKDLLVLDAHREFFRYLEPEDTCP